MYVIISVYSITVFNVAINQHFGEKKGTFSREIIDIHQRKRCWRQARAWEMERQRKSTKDKKRVRKKGRGWEVKNVKRERVWLCDKLCETERMFTHCEWGSVPRPHFQPWYQQSPVCCWLSLRRCSFRYQGIRAPEWQKKDQWRSTEYGTALLLR